MAVVGKKLEMNGDKALLASCWQAAGKVRESEFSHATWRSPLFALKYQRTLSRD